MTIGDSICAALNLTPAANELLLLNALCIAHGEAALSNQQAVSNTAVKLCSGAGVDFLQACQAGLATMSVKHAPVTQARMQIFHGEPSKSGIFAGFGHSFYKEGIDPALNVVESLLDQFFPDQHWKIWECSEVLRAKNPSLFPNFAAYTAAVAEVIRLPIGVEVLLVLMPRLPAWATSYLHP